MRDFELGNMVLWFTTHWMMVGVCFFNIRRRQIDSSPGWFITGVLKHIYLTRPETRHVNSVIFVIYYFFLDYCEKVCFWINKSRKLTFFYEFLKICCFFKLWIEKVHIFWLIQKELFLNHFSNETKRFLM
jgi:hypothetical protein